MKRLALVALCLLTVLPATAQKRRSVRSGPIVAPPPAANCHTFKLVRAGLVATYLTNAQGGDVNFEITYIYDTPTQLKTTQKVQTAQGSADVETIIDGEVSGILRGMKHINVKGSQNVPGFGKVTTETDITFVPSIIAGPAAGWCVGNTWTVSPVTETIVVKSPAGNFTNVVTTVASDGEVLAVGEWVNVPAGDFKTVKYRGVTVAGESVQPAITWVSMDHDIVVKQDTLDAAGNVTSVTRLMRLH